MSFAATAPMGAFGTIPWVDRALSAEARTLRDQTITLVDFGRSMTLGEPKRLAREALDAAYIAAREENWDGLGSERVEPSTYSYANQFLQMLPANQSVLDIAVDTDGEILFEWDRGRWQTFSVSVGRDGTLTFAGLFGQTKIHGTEHLREALPLVIAHCLERLADRSAS
jgi:hypothetical protein